MENKSVDMTNDRDFITAVLDRLLAHPDPAQALDVLERTLATFTQA